MLPIRDDQPRFITPFVTYFLIALNLLVYLFEAMLDPESFKALIFQFAMIPAHVSGVLLGGGGSVPGTMLPLLTSMFLHGSWTHVLGNMWFLWIFGDNIEDYLGHFDYLVFYLLSGLVAAGAQILLNPFSIVPNVGASGAIAGVLGAYFLLFPRARLLTWFPPIFLFHIPAWIMLGCWFVYQFLLGTSSSYSSATEGGIAFWAHVGGFVAGILMIKIFPERERRNRYGTW